MSCVSEGYCYNCRIIIGDYTCFCAGGPCPKCKSHVKGMKEYPEFLHGYVEKYIQGKLVCKYQFDNGKRLSISPSSYIEESLIFNLIKENYSFYLNESMPKHRFGFVVSTSDLDKWYYDFGIQNKNISFKDFCDTIFANGVRKGKLDKEREIKQALGIK